MSPQAHREVFHSPISNLTRPEQIRARERTTQAALLAYHNAPRVHYTAGGLRWDGITERRLAKLGQFPTYADCSSFATWCLWNSLAIEFHCPDVVNGCAWKAGFGGTMQTHGKHQTVENCKPGDCVLYGAGGVSEHVSIIVGRHDGTPMVVSHGSEEGPLYLPWNYRSDGMGIWRYI